MLLVTAIVSLWVTFELDNTASFQMLIFSLAFTLIERLTLNLIANRIKTQHLISALQTRSCMQSSHLLLDKALLER